MAAQRGLVGVRWEREGRGADDEQGQVLYGEGFASGFAQFKESGEFADVKVVTGDDHEYHLHSLLLASRSEFFHRALTGDFRESLSKVVTLQLDSCGSAFPLLVDYFYTDSITVRPSNVLPLMALSRRLLVHTVDAYCREFVASHLCVSNCLAYLRGAVAHALHDVQRAAAALAARSFHFLYDVDFAGLPATTLLDILHHPELTVHCEAQVLRCVLRYLSSTDLSAEPAALRAICSEVRFAFLDNQLLGALASHPAMPRDLLLLGCSQRLTHMDGGPEAAAAGCMDDVLSMAAGCGCTAAAAAVAAPSGGEPRPAQTPAPLLKQQAHAQQKVHAQQQAAQQAAPAAAAQLDAMPWPVAAPQPRPSYCCDLVYGLPGGGRHLTLPAEAVWRHIAARSTIRVSGSSEGHPRNVLSEEPDAWFETNESADPHPWVEVHLPSNVVITSFSRYTFSHGHRRSGYFRMRNWKTLVAPEAGSALEDIVARPSPTEQFEVNIAARDQQRAWRVLRLVGTDRQEDSVYRLCLRNLRVYGTARIDLMRQAGGLVVDGEVAAAAAAAAAAAGAGGAARPGSGGGPGGGGGGGSGA